MERPFYQPCWLLRVNDVLLLTALLCAYPFYKGEARRLVPRHAHKPGALLVLKGVKLRPSTPHPRDRGEVLAQV